jgi:hypothetical protein
MSTSLALIDETYGHLVPEAERVELDLLDRTTRRLDAYWTPTNQARARNSCSREGCGREDSNLQGLAPNGT